MTPNPKIQALIKSMGIIPEDEHYDVAEAVIRECCETIERRYKYSNGTPMSFWEMSQDVQDLLKEHFGVEE